MNSDRCFLALLFALLVFAGCTSTPNEDAPLADEGHPAGWLTVHNQEAIDDVVSCKSCHGADYSGGSVGVSCFTCHLSGPPFTVHPASWGGDTVAGHQNFAAELSWTSCATSGCHGAGTTSLRGGVFDGVETGPSCFTSIVGCHTTTANNGPPAPTTGPAIHTVNYATPADHGPVAKQNQLYCRNCHGRPENNFDGGFVTPNYSGVDECSLCHPDAKAHPTDWQGTNNSGADGYAATHWGVTTAAINNSCSLCHNVSSASPPSPMSNAPTCFNADFKNADNPDAALTCHAGGPLGHDSTSFAWAGTCNDCHTDGGLGIVSGVHNGNCSNCHVSDTDRTIRRTGINGDATQADSLVDPNTANCLTCHDPAVYPTDVFHHLLPSFISRDCVDCHGLNVTHNVSFNATTDLSGVSPCSAVGCHDGEVETWADILTRHDQFNGYGASVCDTCHKAYTGGDVFAGVPVQTSRTGLYNEPRTIENVITTAMNSGATVNCLECHLDRQDPHSGHDATVFSFGADGCDAAGCHDQARYPAGGTPPEVVNDVHGAVCITCHDNAAGGLTTTIPGDPANGVDGDATLAAGPSYAAATCRTCHVGPGVNLIPDIHHDHVEADPVTGDCTFCHAGGPPGHPADFAASSGGCEACHTGANVVNDIHGGQCTLCHASAPFSATNERVGANSDGDATLADGTAAGGAWASVTCLTCHAGLGVNTIPDIHHDNTSAGAGPTEAIAGNCTYCHADPRPALNTANGLGLLAGQEPMSVTALSCRECHTDGAGSIYLNTYAPTSPTYGPPAPVTNASGVTIATNFETVQQTIMDGNGLTVDHSFATTIQNFGACLSCHLANVTTIYGTSAVKVNVFHARPQDWALNGNDTDDTGANDQTEVLRGAPGRETFRMFGDAGNYWPLGNLRDQGWQLCGAADKSYEFCSNNETRWKDSLQNIQNDWDLPVGGFGTRMTIPCGNWNDDGSREYCTGVIGGGGVSTRSVPRF
ncbi:MAG: hypothetical protein ABFS18_09985 [Thermodesulfobacteriota bacterium]